MRPTSRLSRLVPIRECAVGLALMAGLMSAAVASAQTAAPAAAAAAAGPAAPLSAYVPGEQVSLYWEFQGTEAHAAAWQKTSAYKILNETPTGAMLEDVVGQLLSQTTVKTSKLRISGAEAVTLGKHLLKHGFLVAGFGAQDSFVVVMRGVIKNKDTKAVAARLVSSRLDPKVKPKITDVDGHKIVLQKLDDGTFSAYWVDDARKEDLIYIPSCQTESGVTMAASQVFATLDGKTPNATNNPARQALLKEEDGFVPVGITFFDLNSVRKLPAAAALANVPRQLGVANVKKIDMRLGFQDKELVTITRVDAPKPREGLLALVDQPTFEKSNLPPIPEGVTGFSVVAFDPKRLFDQLTTLAKAMSPQAGEQIDAVAAQVKAKTRLRLKEDILGHFGPKMAIYVAPSKSASDAKPGFGPLAMLTGGAEIPRLTLVIDIDDAAAFGRVLDELMIQLNQTLRAAIPAPAVAAAEGDEPRAKSAKNAGAGVEFKMVPGPTKVYMLSYPSTMSGFLPSHVKPTIRVGPKHVVISVSPDSARAALEVKGGGAATTTYAATLQPAPAGLIFANVSDTSETLPKALASFPGALQAKLNAANAPPPAMAANTPGAPGSNGPGSSSPNPSYPPGTFPNSSGAGQDSTSRPQSNSLVPGSSSSSSSGGSSSSGSSSSGSSSSGQPGSGQPGSSAGESGIVFHIDAAKLPTAAAIKPFLSPSLTTVSVDDQGVKMISRSSFPDLSGFTSNDLMSSLMNRARPATPGAAKPGAAGPAGAGAPGLAPPGGPAGASSPGLAPPAGPGGASSGEPQKGARRGRGPG